MLRTIHHKPRGVIGVRELREDTSAVIAQVEQGAWFVVSKRGMPVGVLLPSALAETFLIENASDILSLQLQRGKDRRR